MVWAALSLAPLAFLVSVLATGVMWRLGHRLRAYDAAGVAGQVKLKPRRVPNTGGVGVFAGLALPLLALVVVVALIDADWLARVLPAAAEHLPGARARLPEALTLLAILTILHLLGLIDDRRPLGPGLKLGVMACAAFAFPILTQTRLLELLDPHVGGPWLSYAVTALWILIVTNAMNFMDNMDGLSAGTGAIAASCFLSAALASGQWFVAGTLALLVGTLAGFLVFNAPRPRGALLFMGDSGSLVLGFALAVLAVRTTYVDPARGPTPWYGVFIPLAILAIPLYDFTSVTIIRLSQGRSPFVGDLQHFSHRLVRLGLSRRSAVAVIWGCAAITGFTGIMLPALRGWQALLAAAQVVLILLVLALFEWARARSGPDAELSGKP